MSDLPAWSSDWWAAHPDAASLVLPTIGIAVSLVIVLALLRWVKRGVVRRGWLTQEEAGQDGWKVVLIVIGLHLAALYQLDPVQRWMDAMPNLAQAVQVIGVLAIGWMAFVLVRRVLLDLLAVLVKRTRFVWDDIILERGLFQKLAYLAPIAVIATFSQVFPVSGEVLSRVLAGLVALVVALALGDSLDAANDLYNRHVGFAKDRPIKGYLQTVKLFVYLLGSVVTIAFLLGRSPTVLLTGIGAGTAILLLIFRTTILSLVASIQVATNDMVRIGDWIEMPKQSANGLVTDIALHIVKVKNWDHSTANIPTYKFIEESFNNWRGMHESGGRRIKRAIRFDQASVRFCDQAMLEKLRRMELLQDYIADKLAEPGEGSRPRTVNELVEGRCLTNLGIFRAYAEAYLRSHPRVRDDMFLFVRQLDPGAEGIPVELYCFTDITEWVAYEAIQADIFDHLLAVIPEFDLRVFQGPTGADFRGEPPNPWRGAAPRRHP